MILGQLVVPLWICGASMLVCWVLSLLTRELSWVDRLWSVLPVVYVAWFARPGGWHDPRLNLMAFLAAAWGARLTFNFWRKGGYAPGGEDYRWAEVRRRVPPAWFQVFNLAFVSVIQNLLLLAIALPAWVAARGQRAPIGALDFAAAALIVFFLLGETVADQQQWRFQSEKRARRARGEAIEPGFVTTGLFRYSRHPNFFCEQGIWWGFYLFGVAAGGGWLNPSLAGPVALTALFHGSTRLTESLSARRYPAYAEYQQRTSRLFPWSPARRTEAGRKAPLRTS
jgi:steroid 5-alpha reductase family enzyme